MNLKVFLILFIFIYEISSVNIDPNGYILYCPCMGRFGNQADHFLGALGFAKGLNRTLALPPWVEYRYGEPQSIQVPFDTYFKVEPLMKYHRVITMENFMKDIAPELWPPDKRTVFCYMPRGNTEDCNAKEGNPFGPFWNNFNVDFVKSEFYGPLHYDVHHHDMKEKWTAKYKSSEWPGLHQCREGRLHFEYTVGTVCLLLNVFTTVDSLNVIAFIGAPGSFPVQQENRELHKYLEWNDDIRNKAMSFITTDMPKRKFVGIHLRNGIDWVRACEHTTQSPNLFAAPQCVGYRNELGPATKEMCFPSKETIIKQLKRTIRNSGDIRAVFVASDSNHMIQDLSEALKRMEVTVHKQEAPDPHVDLAILGLAHHFIGNCVSSFSAFVKRERDVHGLASSFWAFPSERSSSVNSSRDEL